MYLLLNCLTNVTSFFNEIFQEKKPESAKKSKKDENGAGDDDEEVDDENEEAEDEEYELNYGEEIDGEGKPLKTIKTIHRIIH
jgi:hypothetical protein